MTEEDKIARLRIKINIYSSVKIFRSRHYKDYIWICRKGREFKADMFKNLIPINKGVLSQFYDSKTSGIYMLLQEDKIVYIGMSSTNMAARILYHATKDWQFNKVITYAITNKTDLALLEIYEINQYKPIYNINTKYDDKSTLSLCINDMCTEVLIYEDIKRK